ncbi:MAG: class I SAM-dependent methyltransferase [Jiangellaceae bacterium]
MFDARVARSDLRRFRRRGPSRPTRRLVEALRAEGVRDGQVLDVGGGVGAVAFSLLAAGVRAVTAVDASRAYLEAAEEEAVRRDVHGRMSFHHGDFVALASQLGDADVTTLDRVLCCDPDMPGLIRASTGRTRALYGAVYPRRAFWTRWGAWTVNLALRLRGSAMRVYVHDPSAIERHVTTAGFRRRFAHQGLLWRVEVYRRTSPA